MPVNDSQMSHTVTVFSKNLTRLIGQKIKSAKISQAQFAKENDFSATAINQWCNGRRFPSDENIDRLCEILQVPLAELFIEPGQLIKFDKENDNVLQTTPIVGNDISVSQLQENINAVLSQGETKFIVNSLTDRLAPIVLPNDSILCTSPNNLKDGCTALCLLEHQFAICSVKSDGNKFVFTNLNSTSQVWQIDSAAAYSSVLGIVIKLSRAF